MNRKKYLAKNTMIFALNSIGTRLITFLLVPLYTKAFIKSEFGIVDLVTTIATLFVPIITINIGEAVMRFSLDENADQDKIVNIGAFILALSVMFGTSIFLIILLFPQIKINVGLVYFYCISQGIYQVFSCILRGKEKLLQFAIGNILLTFLSAILNIVFLLFFKIGINGYFLSYIIANMVAGIYCFISGNVFSSLRKFSIDMKLLKKMSKYSIVLVPNSLMWWLMNSSDHIMVTFMISAAANGVYAISYKLPSILAALASVFNQAWSYSAIHEDKSLDREKFSNTMYDKLVRFQFVITVGLMCIIKPLMKIYVDSAFYDAWRYTPYLLAGNFFLTISTFLSTSYTVNKDSRGFLLSASVGAFINIILNFILIPIIGVHGAAFATCISYIIVFIYRIIDTKKYIVIHVFDKEYIIGYLMIIVTACSMAVPGYIGQCLLILDTFLMMLLNRKFLLECFENLVKIVKNKLIKNE